MNLPNKLTLLRIILVPVFMLFMTIPSMTGMQENVWIFDWLSAIVFGAAALTDMLDGKIARKYNLITNFGKFMDPIADKIMVFGALVSFIAAYDKFRYALVWCTLILLFREFAVTSVRLLAKGASGTVIAANKLGKIKTVSQCVCILAIILEPYVFFWFKPLGEYRLISWLSIIFMTYMTVVSGVEYIRPYKDSLMEN